MKDLPGIFYYHDIKHIITAPNTFTVSVAAKTTSHPFTIMVLVMDTTLLVISMVL